MKTHYLTIPWLIGLFLLTPPAALGQTPPTGERIALAGYRQGQWDIYAIAPDGSNLRQLTNDTFEDSDPAYSPDGTKIAFASRRNNNWDVYVIDLLNGQETRLTSSPHYDGAPTWHPNGQLLAYESYQAENLDLWQAPLDGSEPPVNLTSNSPAGDFAPAYHPTQPIIAFSSWREGSKDLYLLEVDSGNLTRLTNSPAAEEWPAWHPQGDTLAFAQNSLGDREIFTLGLAALPANDGPIRQITWLGRTDGPAWNPAGDALAGVFHRWDGEILTLNSPTDEHRLPRQLTPVVTIQGRLSWHGQAVEFGQPLATLADAGESPLYTEQLAVNDNPDEEPYNLIRQNDIETGTPWLADTVDDSFRAWRTRMRNEVGYDFLSQLSDASRDVGAYTETSQYASWHKSGRAVDTLFDYYLNDQLMHEIVREDYSGETYWRIYLRCVDQAGNCGRPLTANPWNYSARARTEIAPEQGGVEKPNQSGYYVDMTAMAREYGWDRISSYDDLDYSWTWHFLAFEYWHYQKRLEDDTRFGLTAANWYQAMSHIYPQSTLEQYFTWQIMRSLGEDPHLIALKGVPLPLEQKLWWALVEQ